MVLLRPASVCLLIAAVGAAHCAPSLSLSTLFSDHMVLQREQPIHVWGSTAPGDTVRVKLGDNQAEAKASDKGRWSVKLPALKAGGPYEMTVSDSDETTSLQDILIGDVWVCGGQSNMAFELHNASNAAEAIGGADNPRLRIYEVPRQKSITPREELEFSSQWEVASPRTVDDFSAVGYFFGQRLQSELDVPIGLIESSWGGTQVQWWTPLDALEKLDYYRPEAESVIAGITDEELAEGHAEAMLGWMKAAVAGDPGTKENWAAPELDTATWEETRVPANPNRGPLAGAVNGTMWFRRGFTLTPEQAASGYAFDMGCIDDMAVIYVNGKQIGASSRALAPVRVDVPEGALRAGDNVVAIQVLDVGRGGGICGQADGLALIPKAADQGGTVTLAGQWKYKAGAALADLPPVPGAPPSIRPATLYNAMIAPLLKFPVTGAIWYQGEGNASPSAAPHYAEAFSAMISEWRKRWSSGEFPFLFVQLASFRDKPVEPGESDWAVLREQQEKTLSLVKNTGMASAVDVGDEKDIHPRNKQPVGERLAQAALAVQYDKDVVPTGPIYKSSQVQDNTMVISFEHGAGLKTPHGEALKGFAIAGADGKFVWADATIQGETVVVSSEKVKELKAVRYGWADFSVGNLYNGADLPASPFRTDRPD